MRIRSQISRYCQKCHVHTIHRLKRQKAKKMSKMRWIERQKMGRSQRGNTGKFNKTPAQRNKAKRPHIAANCLICSGQSFLRTRRSNRLEFLKWFDVESMFQSFAHKWIVALWILHTHMPQWSNAVKSAKASCIRVQVEKSLRYDN